MTMELALLVLSIYLVVKGYDELSMLVDDD